jgi:GNAT superfamily N-acetyltransferase
MDEQTTVIEKIRIGDLPDYAAAFAASSPPPGTAPMTRIRALSQVKNPCAREDDIGLLVAYRDGRVIGYHGVMPGLLAVDGCISRVHWSTAVFVTEDCRGRGVGRQLIEAFKGLGKDMMVPGVMTPGAQGAYLSSGFRPLGMCSYFQLRVERVDRIASLFNALQTYAAAAGLPIGSPLSRLSGWMLKAQQKVFYRRAAAVLDPGQKAISWRQLAMRRKKAVGTTIRNFCRSFHRADRGGKRYPDRLEDLAAVSLTFTADSKPFAVLLDDDLLERLEILLDMQPLESVTGSRQTLVQFLSQHQCQKAAKHVAGDVGIVLVENRTGFQKRFHILRFCRGKMCRVFLWF